MVRHKHYRHGLHLTTQVVQQSGIGLADDGDPSPETKARLSFAASTEGGHDLIRGVSATIRAG